MTGLAELAGLCALGTLVGATGLVPGLHINTVVAAGGALALAGSPYALVLACAAVAHAFFAVVPATYVGVPGDDAGITVLPAHRMALDGRGREAVAVALDAVLSATMLALVLLLPVKWLLGQPVLLAQRAEPILPAILAAAMLWLAWSERRKGWMRVALAIVVQAAATALGLLAVAVPAQGLVAVPQPQLLPLFAGMFGCAGLVASLAGNTTHAADAPPVGATRLDRHLAWPTLRGTAAALATVAVPGLTPGVGASIAYGRSDDPRRAIAALSATAAAHQVLALGLVFVTLHARTGLAAGVVAASAASSWDSGRPPGILLDIAAGALATALVAWWLARRLGAAVPAVLRRVPVGVPEAAALLLTVLLVGVLAGPGGLFLLACATTVGLMPMALGVRRVQLVALLAWPLVAARVTP